ncbi:MAG: carboxypeptidase-like regulatory domain-containing protein, partial [bacterium]
KAEEPDPEPTLANEIDYAMRVMPLFPTKGDGKFAFRQLQDTAYNLTAFRSAPTEKADQIVKVESVRPGETDIVIRFDEFEEKPVLRGRVIDAETQSLIPEFTIGYFGRMEFAWPSDDWMEANQDLQRGKTISDASGSFIIENLAATRCEFVVSAPGYAARAIGPFDLKPAEEKELIVPLRKEGIIVGRVFSSRPPRKYELSHHFSIHRNSDLSLGEFTGFGTLGVQFESMPDGSFAFRNVPTGFYDISISDAFGKIASATCVSVTECETTRLGALRLKGFKEVQPPDRITIVLKKPDGSPWAHTKFNIRWSPQGNYDRGIETNADGKSTVDTLSWEDSILIEIGESPRALYEVNARRLESVIVHPEIKGDGVLKGVVLVRGMPVIGRRVRLISHPDSDPFLFFQTTSNLLGRFTIENIPPGDYHAIICGEDSYQTGSIGEYEAFMRGEQFSGPDSDFRMVDVSIGVGKEEFIRIPLEGVSLSGQVVDRNGCPANGAYVQIGLPFKHNQKTRCSVFFGPARSTQADEYGRFSFSNLQAGKYEIWASRYSIGVSEKGWVEVGEENVVGVRIVLR